MKQDNRNTTRVQLLYGQDSQAGVLGVQCLPYIKEWFEGLFAACPTGDQEVEEQDRNRHEKHGFMSMEAVRPP